MSTASHGRFERVNGGIVDDSSLISAAANELSGPLVLLRQLSFAVADDTLTADERRTLSERLTLTTERALRMAASLSIAPANGQLELEPINSLNLCQEVVHELTPLFAAHDQKLSLQPRTRIPLLVGNRQILQQILLSFADNALFYGSHSHPVRMTIAGVGDKVRIGVRDYGPAVPIDVWNQLESRVAAKAPTPLASRPHISTVGLIAAKRLAELMGSAVGVTRHNDGATFYIDLGLSGQMSLL